MEQDRQNGQGAQAGSPGAADWGTRIGDQGRPAGRGLPPALGRATHQGRFGAGHRGAYIRCRLILHPVARFISS